MTDVEITLDDHRELDLYCARCGYNLRGLPGDPIRCPECGLANTLQELLLPADAITKQLRKLESAPTYCYAGTLSGVVGILILAAAWSSPQDWRKLALIWAPALLFAAIAWPLGARKFASSCMHQPGWGIALFKFHLYAVAIFVLGYGAFFGTCLIPASIMGPVFGRRSISVVAVIIGVGVAWLVAIIGIRILYSRAKGVLAPLQREVAVAMYVRERERLGW